MLHRAHRISVLAQRSKLCGLNGLWLKIKQSFEILAQPRTRANHSIIINYRLQPGFSPSTQDRKLDSSNTVTTASSKTIRASIHHRVSSGSVGDFGGGCTIELLSSTSTISRLNTCSPTRSLPPGRSSWGLLTTRFSFTKTPLRELMSSTHTESLCSCIRACCREMSGAAMSTSHSSARPISRSDSM